jgi:hypothetical protein
MTKNRKYFGMTATQIGILVSLAGVACLLFALTGWFVFRGNSSLFASAPQNTPVLQSTSTPFVIPTLTPTETPTAIPYEQRIPNGWKQFKTTLVELWLPSAFDSVDPQQFISDSNATARELGLTASSGSIFGDAGTFDLILLDDTPRPTFTNLVVYITYEALLADSLDQVVDTQISKLPMEYVVTERRKVKVGNYDAIRVLGEIKLQLIQANQLVYIIQDGSTVWLVMYTTKLEEFYTQLPVFEESIQTFRTVQ